MRIEIEMLARELKPRPTVLMVEVGNKDEVLPLRCTQGSNSEQLIMVSEHVIQMLPSKTIDFNFQVEIGL